jgi:hypothetical protein
MNRRLSGKRWALVVAAVAAVGCGGDDGGGGGGLSVQEKQALATALATSGALSGSPAAAFAPFALAVINEIGSMGPPQIAATLSAQVQAAVAAARSGSYEGAFGIDAVFSLDIQGQQNSGYLRGVVGWNGLNASAQTVDELVTAMLVGIGTTPAPDGTYPIGGGTAFATYWDGVNAYFADAGDVEVNASFGGSSTDCSQSSPPYTITCSYRVGTMTGDFLFSASGEGGDYSQPAVAYSLPAVRITLTITD